MDFRIFSRLYHTKTQRQISSSASLCFRLIKIGIMCLALLGCTRVEPSRAEFALGTICHVTLYEQGREWIYRDIFSRIREIENLMSVNIPSSDVSRINAAAGIAPVQVHEEVFRVIERAVFFAELSGGAFDPTVGPLVSLWNISDEDPRLPSREEIDEVLPLINWRDIELDASECSVFLKRRGMALDLGAIAKGYAADEAAEVIRNARINRAIINLGGDVVILGERKDKNPWRVGVQDPNREVNNFLGVLLVPAADEAESFKTSVVTSGVNERFFEKDGERFHHIFSPVAGYPVKNGLLSVTIIAANSMDADAFSTLVFVLGFEEGTALLDSFPGADAVFVLEDLTVRKTSGVDFTLTENIYQLVP